MSNEEKQARQKHQEFRKKWIKILTDITIVLSVLFVTFLILNHINQKVVYIDYTENSTVDYKVYLKQNDLIGIISIREGCIFGAVIGFVSFLTFSVAFTPISMLLGWLIPSYTQGFSRLRLSMLRSIAFPLAGLGLPSPRTCPFKVSPCLSLWWSRNIYRVCIDYAFRPRLSSRLTRSGRTFLLKP